MSATSRIELFLIAATVAVLGGASAHAQAWKPDKTVEIIVGTSGGGPQDRMGRSIPQLLQDKKLVDATSIVMNKAGGGGAVGLSYLTQHAGDGRYLMIVATTLLANHVAGKSPAGPDDVTPIAIMGVEYVGVTVRADSPLKTGKDLIERLKKDPSSLSVAIGAPQRGSGELANVPTWKELGVNSSFELWRGLAGPKGMSRAQVQFWDETLAKLVKSDEWQKELAENQVANVYKPSADTAKHWKAEYNDVRAVLSEIGMAK